MSVLWKFKNSETGDRMQWQPVVLLLPPPPAFPSTDQTFQSLPTITQLAKPSHHWCARKHCFASFFSVSSSSVCFGFSFLFQMEILRSIGVACYGRADGGTKGRMRDVWREGERQSEVMWEIWFWTGRERESGSHVFFISAGGWWQMEQDESWLDPSPTHKHCTYWRPPFTTLHPHQQPHPLPANWCRAEDCSFPDSAASSNLLHYLS